MSVDTMRAGFVFVLNGMLHAHEHGHVDAACFQDVLSCFCFDLHASWHTPGLSASLSENRRIWPFSESETRDTQHLPWPLCAMHASLFMLWAMFRQHAMPRAHMWSAREVGLRPEPGLTAACSAAQKPNGYVLMRVACPTCHET